MPKVTWVSSYYLLGPKGEIYPYVCRYDDGRCIRIICAKSRMFGGACNCKTHYPIEEVAPGHPDYDMLYQEADIRVSGFRAVDARYPFIPKAFFHIYRHGTLVKLSQDEIDDIVKKLKQTTLKRAAIKKRPMK